MSKQSKEPTKFLARMNGSFDVDPVDADEIRPGDQLVIVSVVKVRSVGTEDEEASGEAKWVSTLKVRSADIVRDEELLDRLAEELGIVSPDPKLPFPPAFVPPAPAVALDDDDDDDDDDDVDVVVVAAPMATVGRSDDALRAFLSADA